ncbi:MAG: hypothetical protein ACD_41C00142G0007 [uncultured bacterium]|nr:MAG: hypothetical protein ACD_41C00142G0007 [uncultured bacterium]HBY73140.1 hypothetical protein [Candidatus Kerfeldbacteria bacterium]
MNKPVFGELFLDRTDGRNAIHLFAAQPTPLEDKNLGRAFALIEFDQAEPFTEQIVQTIDETFSEALYRSSDFETEAAFERALHKVNNAVHDLINAHGEAWTYQCNALLGVIHDTSVYVSTSGKVDGYLVQGETISDIIQRSQTTEVQPLKLFSSIVAGKCPERGGLLFTTGNLLDYLSLEKLRRIVKDHTASEAVDYLNGVLSEQDTLANIAAFIIKFENVKAVAPSADHPELDRSDFTESGDSMSKLIEQEKATGDLLTPSIWPALKKRVQNTEQRRAVSDNYVRSQNPYVNALQLTGRFLLNLGKQFMVIVGNIAKWLGQMIQKLFRNRDTISATVGGSVSGAAGWWKRLSLAQKIFVSFLAATVLVFVISVFTNDRSNDKADLNEQYAATLQEVDNLLGETESKQLMKDESGARTSLAKASELLAGIPKDSEAYEVSGSQLQGRINQLDGAVNKVTIVTEPTVVGDFSTSVGSATIGTMALIGKNVFGFAQGSAGIWRLNIEKQEVTNVLVDAATTSGYRSIENDTAATSLAVIGNTDFVQFNPVLEKTSDVTVQLKDNDLVVTDMDVFGDRLYVLAAQQNRIVRLQKSGSSYTDSTSWLNDGVDVSNAVSFDIDGSIYVLLADGVLNKYDSGEKSDFEMDAFSPSLAGATRLIKNDPTDPFIVLNPTTQRIVVLEGDGSLRAQYSSPAFAQATDVVYDADANTVYVVAGNKVYSITI